MAKTSKSDGADSPYDIYQKDVLGGPSSGNPEVDKQWEDYAVRDSWHRLLFGEPLGKWDAIE